MVDIATKYGLNKSAQSAPAPAAPVQGGTIRAKYAQFLPTSPAAPVDDGEATFFQRAVDTGIDLAKGVVGAGESAVGMGDLATGNLIGNGLRRIGYDPARTRQILESGYSAERQKENEDVHAADGFLNTVIETIHNPSVGLGTVVESSPMLLGAAGAVRSLATNLLAKQGLKIGVSSADDIAAFLKSAPVKAKLAAAGGATEGLMAAGSNQEQARQAGRTYAESAPYSAAAGAGTALIGTVAGKLGLGDIETAAGTMGMAGSTLSMGKRIARGMFQEGVLEELPQSTQEQIFSNLSQGNPWDEGVPEAAATGLLAGGGMGGIVGAFERQTPEQKTASQVNKIMKAPTVDDAIKAATDAINTPDEPADIIPTVNDKLDIPTLTDRADIPTLGDRVQVTPLAKTPTSSIAPELMGLLNEATESLGASAEAPPADGLVKAPQSTQPIPSENPATAVSIGARVPFQPEAKLIPEPSNEAAKINSAIDNAPVDKEGFAKFSPESGTLNVPRAEMPQIKAEHRGAMVNFFKGRGIDHTQETVPASTLKPTQAEYSPAKVKQAREHEGGDRSILVSSDGYIVDGHHQALSKDGGDVDVIRINAPIKQILQTIHEFPSAGMEAAPSVPAAVSGERPANEALYKAQQDADSKAKADAEVPGFSLSGSTSKVDQAEARGQKNIFDAPKEERASLPLPEVAELPVEEVEAAPPATQNAGMQVEFNGKRYPVASIQDAKKKWEQFRTTTEAGASDIGSMPIFEDGKQVGRISYNGRAWDMDENEIGGTGKAPKKAIAADKKPAKKTDFKAGDRVQHNNLSEGTVLSADGDMVTVKFDGSDNAPRPMMADVFRKIEADLPSIVTAPKAAYLKQMVKASGIKKGSPGYDEAVTRVEAQYEEELDKAYASLPFEQYNALNSEVPESINRQAYDQLQAEYGKGDDEILASQDYVGNHRPPGPEGGAPLHDLTGAGNVYPDDVYSSKAVQYYGSGEPALDASTIRLAQSFKGRPNATVTIYRAIPDDLTNEAKLAKLEKQMADYQRREILPAGAPTGKSVWYNQVIPERDRLRALVAESAGTEPQKITINPGDWVSINRQYAKEHGESALQGNYKIISKKVKASEVFTNGDSIHEWGYWPNGMVPLDETITIDGVERATQNSNGDQIATTEEGVHNFWKWFGNSKIVDAQGRPQVVYHGTDAKFTKINMRKGAQGLFWFTSDKSAIEAGEVGASGKGVIMEMYAKIENPADWDQYGKLGIGELKGRGLDGAVLPEDGQFVGFVLEPTQIKSVRNKGQFDPANKSILAQAEPQGWLVAEPGTKGMTADAVRKAIAPALEKLNQVEGFDVAVVQSISEMPQRIQDWAKANGNRQRGIYSNGTVYLIADNIQNARQAQVVVAHELIGHKGVLDAATPEEWADIKTSIANLLKFKSRFATEIMAEVHRRYDKKNADGTVTPVSEEVAFKEFIALAAERKEKRGTIGDILAKVKEILRRFLKSMGLTGPFSESDIEIILSNSERYLKQSGAAQQAAGDALASRADDAMYADLTVAWLKRNGYQKAIQPDGSLLLYRAQGTTSELMYPTKAMVRGGEPVEVRVNPDQVQPTGKALAPRGALYSNQAPTFYSALLNTVKTNTSSPRKGDAPAWKSWLDGRQKAGEIKKAERDWLGLDAWLDNRGSTTRDELANFIEANQVQVQDVLLGGGAQELEKAFAEAGYDIEYDDTNEGYEYTDPDGDSVDYHELPGHLRAQVDHAFAANEGAPVKFKNYQLPGGENYRELLLTLPPTINELPQWKLIRPDGQVDSTYATEEAAQRASRTSPPGYTVSQAPTIRAEGGFRSSHFDQPNILAHVRFNERVDAEGRKVLFLEEIQSDLHQQGRKKGYASTVEKYTIGPDPMFSSTTLITFASGYKINTTAARAEMLAEKMVAENPSLGVAPGTVPDAPFKATDEWAMLAFKRMVRYAVDNGFDSIAWTTGEQQNERYDLSKQVSEIRASRIGKDQYGIEAVDLNGQIVMQDDVSAEKLPDVVGKDLADKIVNQSGRDAVYSGVDLKVGGSGMKGFYDSILPSAVNKWAKKFGGKVERTTIDVQGRPEQGTGLSQRMEYVGPVHTARSVAAATSRYATSSESNVSVERQLHEIAKAIHDGADPAAAILEHGSISAARALGGDLKPVAKVDAEQPSLKITDSMRDAADAGLPLFSQSAQTDTPEFKRWFGDSKVVDKNGEPLVVYHGSAELFNVFDSGKNGEHTGVPNTAVGFFFTSEARQASEVYAGKRGHITEAYLSIQKPLNLSGREWDVDASSALNKAIAEYAEKDVADIESADAQDYREYLKRHGYDGIVVTLEKGTSFEFRNYVVFEPTRIKSAIGNNGQFDPNNPSILASQGESEFEEENRRIREEDVTTWDKAKKLLRRGFAPGGMLSAFPDAFKEVIERNGKLGVVELTVQKLTRDLERAIETDYGVKARNLSDADKEALSEALAGKIPPGMKESSKVAIVAMRQYIEQLSSQYIEILERQKSAITADFDTAEQGLLDAFTAMREVPDAVLETGKGEDVVRRNAAKKAAVTRQRNKILDAAKEEARKVWGDGKRMQESLTKVGDAASRQSLIETITRNKENYVHRSYQVFDDPKWFQKIPRPVLDKALDYLANRHMEEAADKDEPITREEAIKAAGKTVERIIKNDTAYDDMESFIKESKLGAKDLSVLIKRKQIAPEIRALMGEYRDPRMNFAKTATKMSRLIFNQVFLEKLREQGMGVYLFSDEDAPPNAVKIAADGSDVYSPLNGLWTLRDFNQGLKDATEKKKLEGLWKIAVQLNGYLKAGKTVGSPMSAARNFQSGFLMTVMNGHWDYTQMQQAIQVFKSFSNKEKFEYVKKLVDLGVLYDSPMAEEMMALIRDAKADGFFSDSALTEASNKVWDGARELYSFGDNFWKAIGFENEKANLMKYGKMTESQAEKEAAERIRNTYPTYSMVGRAIQSLRRNFFLGTFVSFPAEVIRTTFMAGKYVVKDWNTPGMRPVAVKRIIGMTIAAGFAAAIQAAAKAALGFDDDDEEAIRLQAPRWVQNSNILITGRDEKGNVRYVDLSFLDPYGWFKRPVNALLRDQPVDEAMISAGVDMLAPFLGTDILAGTIGEIWYNKKDTGGEVYNPDSPIQKRIADIGTHLRKAAQPGIIGNMERSYRALDGQTNSQGTPYVPADEAAAWLGWRVSTVDPVLSLKFRSFDFTDAKAGASSMLKKVLTDTNDVSDDEIMEAYETALSMRKEAYTDMIKIVQAAKNSGLENSKIMQAMTDMGGVSKADARLLVNGTIPAWAPTTQQERNALKSVETLVGKEKADEIRRRYQLVRAIPAE